MPSTEWSRRTSMVPQAGPVPEVWERRRPDGGVDCVPVEVRFGKPLDVLGLRPVDPDEARGYLHELRTAADALRGGATMARTACPCCGAPAATGAPELTVTDIPYTRCGGCGHLWVVNQPTPEALAARFRDDDALSGVYTDTAALERRMRDIVAPKLDWVRDAAARFGRGVARSVDLGAGGGHFVAAARRAGLDASGFEISLASCAFARDVLGVDLVHGDVLAAAPPAEGVDVVTLWGVLEYVPEPAGFVEHAARFLADDGLLVVEVPRADALSTAVQRAFPDTVWRHMEPTSHVNVFSDASLATLLWDAGFAPVAAWYFGMDAYELVCQLAMRLPADAVAGMAPALVALQPVLDRARLCDDVIVAAVRR